MPSDRIGDRGEDQRQDEAGHQRRAGPVLEHDPGGDRADDERAPEQEERLAPARGGEPPRAAARNTAAPAAPTPSTRSRAARGGALAGDCSEVADDRDRGRRCPARRRSRRRGRAGRSPRGPSGGRSLISRVVGRSGHMRRGGSFAAGRRSLDRRRIALAAPCWTSARSTPPASPQTGASRSSSASAPSPRLHARRGRGGRRRLGAGVGGALALAELPWFFAFGARWRLLDDALAGVPFAVARRPRRRVGDRARRGRARHARARRGARLPELARVPVLRARRRRLHRPDRLDRGCATSARSSST